MANDVIITPGIGEINFTTGSSTSDYTIERNLNALVLTNTETGSTTNDRFIVRGLNDDLFIVTDSMDGSLMAVNDISGMPVLDVQSTGDIYFNAYAAGFLKTSGTTGKVVVEDVIIYGTGDPPSASGYTEGTLYIRYSA